jgi:hypothetical protein
MRIVLIFSITALCGSEFSIYRRAFGASRRKDGRLSSEPVLGDLDSHYLRTPSSVRHLRTSIVLTNSP